MAAGRLVKVRFDKTDDGSFGLVDEVPQRYQAFPRAIYHANEAPRIVNTKEGLDKAIKAGWSKDPIRAADCDKREPSRSFDDE